MTTITATHTNGSKITIRRESNAVARTKELMKQSGYVVIEVAA